MVFTSDVGECSDCWSFFVMAFDLLRVEQMVRSLIADQLRYIELLGAVLGAIVGLTLPYLNRLL